MLPSEAIINDSIKHEHLTDAAGRIIEVKRLTPVDTLRLLKAAGPILSENSAWLGMAALTIAVVSIDGIPVPSPASENQIESIIGKLGEHGMTAISEWSETLIAAQASAFKANAGN